MSTVNYIAVPGLMRYFSKPLSRSGRGVWGEGLYLMEMRSAIAFLNELWKTLTPSPSPSPLPPFERGGRGEKKMSQLLQGLLY
jgi:hypothetical protein